MNNTTSNPIPMSPPDSAIKASDLTIQYQALDSLLLRETNARTHSRKQIRQLADSIQQFGFTNPILIDEWNVIVAGHGRVAAAKHLGLTDIPTICLKDLSEAQIRAYVIADNKLAENAGWDEELLAMEFKYLDKLDIDFDLTITGFEAAEIDLIIEPVDEELECAEDIPEVNRDISPISRLGDLWQLGDHRLYCGNATEAVAYTSLMGSDKARLVFTDPPYNVRVNGHISGLGKIKHPEFQMASGEMSQEDFTSFLTGVFTHLNDSSVDGSLHFICMDWRHLLEILTAGQIYSELKNLCVWAKDNGGMGSLYRSQHELILLFKNGNAPHINNIELGKHGRNRTNVWQYTGANSFQPTRMTDLAMHPTVKPVAMVKDAIFDTSYRGDVILDVFGGSGTTLIAAELAGRRGYMMELDPHYVDVTIERYQTLTGVEAVHEASGRPFSEMASSREQDSDSVAQDLLPASESKVAASLPSETPDA